MRCCARRRAPTASRPPAPDMAGIPVATYNYKPATPGEPAVTFNMNGETVDFIPMMPSHTAGDTIVRFRKANVIYIEDFYRNFGYPFADQANGGSIKGMLEAVDLIEKLAGPDTTLIPGHGTLVKKKDLLPYRAMLVDIMAKVKTLRDQGKSLKDVLAANLTAPYDKTTHGRHAAEQGSLHHRGVRRGEGLSAGRGRKADDAEASVGQDREDARSRQRDRDRRVRSWLARRVRGGGGSAARRARRARLAHRPQWLDVGSRARRQTDYRHPGLGRSAPAAFGVPHPPGGHRLRSPAAS